MEQVLITSILNCTYFQYHLYTNATWLTESNTTTLLPNLLQRGISSTVHLTLHSSQSFNQLMVLMFINYIKMK